MIQRQSLQEFEKAGVVVFARVGRDEVVHPLLAGAVSVCVNNTSTTGAHLIRPCGRQEEGSHTVGVS